MTDSDVGGVLKERMLAYSACEALRSHLDGGTRRLSR